MAKVKKEIKEEAKVLTKEEKIARKNAPVYSFDIETKNEDGTKKEFRIELKKPTRTMLADADMFYSIQLSKYIKMGLLTAEQLAKRQVDIGGTFSEEQQKHYAHLQALIAEKQEMFLRLMAQKELSPDEEDRKKSLYEDMSLLRSQIMDYEYIKTQVYEHTANAKARNDVILWWVLNLANCGEIIEGKETVVAPMFVGETHETRKLKLDEMEDNENELLAESFHKMIKAVTLWYWIGISDKQKLDEMLVDEEKA